MANQYYNTDVLLESLKEAPKASSFLTRRYFPETELSEFATGDVLVEYKDGNAKAAPFVVPCMGGVAIDKEGYKTTRFTPANIEIKKILKVEDLNQKGFGEALLTNLTPEEREQRLLAEDLADLDDRTTRRIETMAASVLLNSKIEMSYISPDGKTAEQREIRYYDEVSNPNTATISTKWDQNGADPITDLFNICTSLTKYGIIPEDVIITPKVMKAFRKNSDLMKLFDNRNYEIGKIDPKEFEGATLVGKLNADGFILNVIMYNDGYDLNGTMTPYITDGYIVVTSPAIGQTVYGAVTQKEEFDRQTHTYAGRRVPKVVTDVAGDKSEVKMTSKPLLAPAKQAHAWISAQAVA